MLQQHILVHRLSHKNKRQCSALSSQNQDLYIFVQAQYTICTWHTTNPLWPWPTRRENAPPPPTVMYFSEYFLTSGSHHEFIINIICLHFTEKYSEFSDCSLLGSAGIAQYSDWLQAGRLRGWSSSPGRVKNFHFSMSSRPALGFTQPPIQWVPEDLSQG
jgi:hypothetical protein